MPPTREDFSVRNPAAPETRAGYVNRNRQRVLGAYDVPRGGPGQVAYAMRCEDCSHEYGVSGIDCYLQNRPACQGGPSGLRFRRP